MAGNAIFVGSIWRRRSDGAVARVDGEVQLLSMGSSGMIDNLSYGLVGLNEAGQENGKQFGPLDEDVLLRDWELVPDDEHPGTDDISARRRKTSE